MTSQCLDDFPGLAVIEHVHDIAVPEGVCGVTGIEKCTPSASARLTACFSQLRMVSSVTAHNGSRRRGRVGDHPAFHLPDIAYIRQRNQADFIFWRASAYSSRTHFFGTGSAQTVLLHPGQMIPVSASGLRQYAFRYSRGWRTAYGDADPAYRKEGHSLPGPAGRPVWPLWKWPFFSGRALLQNPPPAQWVTGRRVLVNSAGE